MGWQDLILFLHPIPSPNYNYLMTPYILNRNFLLNPEHLFTVLYSFIYSFPSVFPHSNFKMIESII